MAERLRAGALGLGLGLSLFWVGLAGAQSLPPLVTDGARLGPQWRSVSLPSPKFALTGYSAEIVDGKPALRIEAKGAYGNWVHEPSAGAPPRRLSWSWRLQQPNKAIDLRSKAGDDTPARVCLGFDLPLDRLPFFERQLFSLARSQSPQALPSATLCWVWGAGETPGVVIENAYSRRVRYIVLRTALDATGRWYDELRDVAADFRRAFGDELGAGTALPPLVAVVVAGDADNTGAHSIAHVSGLRFEP